MIDPYLLTELTTFYQVGTLTKTAEQLNMTQPSITRGMQKLEEKLGVKLFERHANRLVLTKTGQLAAIEAEKLLQNNQDFVTKIRNFDQLQHRPTIMATIPGPFIILTMIKARLSADLFISHDLIKIAEISDLLQQNAALLVFSNQELFAPQIESRYLGTEQLAVDLNRNMAEAKRPRLHFADITGHSFIVYGDIGVWRDIIQQEIPNANFMYQSEWQAMKELIKFSDFPYFSTNLSRLDPDNPISQNLDDNRIELPISDASAQMPIYGNYLTVNAHRVTPILKIVQAAWPPNFPLDQLENH
ncbi:LysR family transcriptional regulator [Lactobacillus xylocopicola]|uniref:LysR family transcriptional regulator n=1 Tax=Lactobacillus xylocopicola TaxID=2976676 RepID=A0ABM8BGB0_9LACO|nr:LysR family transcriptional regulator [Lactobacillus xylocopicola]BDR60292.1 LysR family transcriptional regulator [Lactobacillus xylocopicola]